MKRERLFWICIGALLLALACRGVDAPAPTIEPSAAPEETPETVSVVETTAAPTPEPTPAPTDTPEPTETPEPTPDGLLGGRYEGFIAGEPVKTELSYKSERVSVEVARYDSSPLQRHLVYFVADIHIQDIEALRTASWDGQFGWRGERPWAKVDRMAREAGALIAINGDYYTYHPHTGLVFRNGERYAPDPWKPWKGHQILLLYRDGTVAVFESDTFDPETIDFEQVWQGWEFGPSLLDENGAARTDFHKAYKDINRENPRTAIGYYEPGHYCFVVIDGRKTGYSNGLTLAQEAQLMESLGCTLAFNLDGGQTTQLYWNDTIYNVPYDKGRSTSDIIYIVDPEKPTT